MIIISEKRDNMVSEPIKADMQYNNYAISQLSVINQPRARRIMRKDG